MKPSLISPDGQHIATGCYDGIVRIWDSTGKLEMLMKEHTGPVFALKWSRASSLLLSGSHDKRAIIWSTETGTIVKAFPVHSGPVLDVDWKDGDYFATCSSDKYDNFIIRILLKIFFKILL